jgi:iron complex outermembrane receptor protein
MIRMASWRDFARLSIVSLVGAAFCLMPALPAAAAESADEEDDVELEEVQVTGTRIQNPNVSSANPITSITGEEMRQLGFVNVADALLMLVPQNISTYQPGLAGDIQTSGASELGNIGVGFGNGSQGNNDVDRGSLFIGSTIANLRGMDPMFGSRTLTLIDGRRTVSSSSQADIVDMNIIPSNLLQRMDVVTGGASATYGSGAMAGVVNLVLNNRLQGVKLDLDYGVNEAGDGGSPHASISGGMRIGEKGHGLLSFEWQNQTAIRDCAAARSWCAESRTMFTNSQSSLIESNYDQPIEPLLGFEGQPARFQMADMRFNQFSSNGVIYEGHSSLDPAVPVPSVGLRFTPDGTGIEEFAYGYRGARNLSSVMNGDGPLSTTGTTLRPQSERKNFFGNFEYDFTETTTAYLQGSYAITEADNNNRYTTSTACARFDAPGIPAVAGSSISRGQVVQFGSIGESHFVNGIQAPKQHDVAWENAVFRGFVGAGVPGGLSAQDNTPVSGGFTRRGAPWMISFILPSGVNSATTATAGGPLAPTSTPRPHSRSVRTWSSSTGDWSALAAPPVASTGILITW